MSKFHEYSPIGAFGGVDLHKAKARKKNNAETIQVEHPLDHLSLKGKRLPTEVDNEIELIDLSNLTSITPEEDAELSSLNHRIVVKHPVKWEINGTGGSHKIYEDGSIEFNEKGNGDYFEIYPKCKTPIRPKITHTQIISLLTQNPTGGTRSPHFCYNWDQTDEGYYRAQANKGRAEYIASTTPNYYCVPENSLHRGMFKCPELEKILATVRTEDTSTVRSGGDETDEYNYFEDNCDYGYGHDELPPPSVRRGDILIYVSPKTGQASYVCPRCTYNNKTEFGGTGHPVKHSIDRELRERLSDAGIIPVKEYKNQKRTDREADNVVAVLEKVPRGLGAYQIDKICGWPEKTTQRLVRKYLTGVVVERTKNGKTRLYLVKKQQAA